MLRPLNKGQKPIHQLILISLTLLSMIMAYLSGGVRIIYPLAGLLLGGVLSAAYTVKQLKGISGDLCGFIITVSELCALFVLAVV